MSENWKRQLVHAAGLLAVTIILAGGAKESLADADATVSAADDSAAWPIEIINRPLTLPEGWFSAGLAFGASSDFSTVDSSATGLWGVSYGVTDELSVGIGYSLALKEFEQRGPFDVNAGYTYLVSGPLTLTGTAGYTHDFMTGGDAVSAGTMMWLMLGDRFALISPGGQIGYGIDDSALTVSAPVALGFQASKRIFAQLGINLAELGVANADTTLFGADQTALELAVFASPHESIDIGATVGTDPKTGVDDTTSFGLVVMINRGLVR